MPDGAPNLATPLPDEAHEALRLAVLAAVDDLQTQVQRISDAFLLLLSTADFAQSTLNTTIAGQAAIGQTQAQVTALGTHVADLTGRVAALEALAAPPVSTPTI